MEEKNEKLWKQAEARVGFKRHLVTYLIINVFLWILWALTSSHQINFSKGWIPWPFWATVGWGIGVFFNYIGAYHNGNNEVEKEYEKLKRRQEQ